LAVLTVALAVGADVAVFTVVDGMLLAPLPYDRPDGLVQLWMEDPGDPGSNREVTPDAWRAWSESPLLAGSGVVSVGRATLTGLGDPTDVLRANVSPSLLVRLGAAPVVGRLPAEEDASSGTRVILLAHAFWRKQLGADPDVVGHGLTLNGSTYTVVGVARAGFRLPLDRSVVGWSPYAPSPSERSFAGYPAYGMIGWTDPGHSVTIERLGADLRRRMPPSGDFPDLEARAAPLDALYRPSDSTLPVLLGAVTLVLLLAALNVIQLLVARGLERLPELGVRVALGAAPGAVRGLLLVEGAVLGLAGSAVGIGLAVLLLRVFVAVDPGHVPGWADLRVTPRVASYAAAVAFLVTAVAAAAPALYAGRRAPAAALARRPGGSAPATVRLQRTLLAVQTALAVVLLAATGLLLRSWQRVQAVDPGFDVAGLRAARVVLPIDRYNPGDGAAHLRFFEELREALEARPEIASATVATALPGAEGLDFDVELRPEASLEAARTVRKRTVGPGYFETLGIRLLAGRLPDERDGPDAEDVAVLDRSAAVLLFGADDPADVVGRALVRGGTGTTSGATPPMPPTRVVGVVEDAREVGPDRPAVPLVFEPFVQSRPFGRMWVAVRAARSDVDPWPAVHAALRGVDAALPLVDASTLRERMEAHTAPRRFNLLLLSFVGGLAFVIAMVGVGGLSAFVAARRRRQVAVRVALGAGRTRAVLPGLTAPLAGVAVGVVLGLAGVALARPALAALLFGVEPWDPLAVGGAVAAVAAAAATCTLVPGLRASRMEPREILEG
jgi:predicted permease